MAERKEREAMYFKVFFSHFTTPVVGTVAKLAGLPGFTPVVLQRRPLDVYISNAKATQVGSWQKADTTDLRIKLSAKHYAEWAEKARRWYAQVNEGLKKAGATPWRCTYEQDVDMAPEALAAHWATHLGLTPPAKLDTSKVLARQDRNPDWRLKVSNAADFEQALRQANLWDEALGGFAGPR
jgi:LPS sulfotransferase NodH